MVGFKCGVDDDVVKFHSLTLKGPEHELVGASEALDGEGGCAQPVLVGHHHQLVVEGAGYEGQAGDDAGQELQFLVGVDLLVGFGLDHDSAVAVDKQCFFLICFHIC